MEEKIFQLFILGTGEYLDSALEKGLGGVIFFTKDIQSKEQFNKHICNIKTKSKIPPFLSIDQEGGRVERTEKIYQKHLSARFAFQKGGDFLTNQTEEIASELTELGLNLNFAPCIDVNTNPNNPIIGERSFSCKTEDVVICGKIVSNIYRKHNIIPCVKHYPGHGDADKDSHLTLPCINLPLNEMEEIHIKPFKEAVNDNIEMIMAAHLHCTCFDKEQIPSSLSKNAIGYLRNKLNYNGIIISDDMVMKGVQKFGSTDAVIKGIDAGLDMFIFRNADSETYKTIEETAKIIKNDKNLIEKVYKSFERITELKHKYCIM